MKIIELTCTKCGANLSVNYDDGMKYTFCQYCGQKMILDDGSIDIRVHHDGVVKEEKHEVTEDKTETIKHITNTVEVIAMVVLLIIILYGLYTL